MRYLKSIITIFILSISPYTASAGQGKAIVSHWYAFNNGTGNYQNSNFFISNITHHNLAVKITLYNKDGTIYSSGLTYNNFQNNNTEIGAGQSVNFKITAGVSPTDVYGYAVIEWWNLGTDDDVVGLIAWADWSDLTPSYPTGYSIQINNGNPF